MRQASGKHAWLRVGCDWRRRGACAVVGRVYPLCMPAEPLVSSIWDSMAAGCKDGVLWAHGQASSCLHTCDTAHWQILMNVTVACIPCECQQCLSVNLSNQAGFKVQVCVCCIGLCWQASRRLALCMTYTHVVPQQCVCCSPASLVPVTALVSGALPGVFALSMVWGCLHGVMVVASCCESSYMLETC